jgi:hypothetical protein
MAAPSQIDGEREWSGMMRPSEDVNVYLHLHRAPIEMREGPPERIGCAGAGRDASRSVRTAGAVPALMRHLPASAEAVWDVLPSQK